jgi:type IV secretory pathway VirB3-like protein
MKKVYKTVEKPSMIFGLPFQEFGAVMLFFLSIFILLMIVNIFFRVGKIWFLADFLLTFGLYFLLKYAAKKNQQYFLASLFSFKKQIKIID